MDGPGHACGWFDWGHRSLPPGLPPPPPPPHPWTSLNARQQFLLAPLQARWEAMPPIRQEGMLRRADAWARLPAERQQQIRQRIEQWQRMSPAERERIRANVHSFHQLSPMQRERLHQAFERFQQLPLDQRQALIQRWHQLDRSQRQAWIDAPGEHAAIPPPPMHEPWPNWERGPRSFDPAAGPAGEQPLRDPMPPADPPPGPPPWGFGPPPGEM